MGNRDLIIVGASAGGIEPLQTLVSRLPPDLNAAVFVVLHVPPWHQSKLPQILSDTGPLRAEHPVPGEPIRGGRIYVAPPDYHLQVNDSHIQLWRGPKENNHRPSINAALRSAAVAYRDRAIGVILSGALEDGATGLWWIKQFGGTAIVQNPEQARFPDMPNAAIAHVDVDYVLPVEEMPKVLTQLTLDDHSEHVIQETKRDDWQKRSG